MKCNNCGKFIPDVSITCPYCQKTVDPNAKVIDFGDIENTEYENKDKFDIKVFVNEPANKKKVLGIAIGGGALIVLLISIIAILIAGSKQPDYKLFTMTIDRVTTYLEDNFITSKTSSSGKYSLLMSVNDKKFGFDGNYGYDVKNRVVSLDGIYKDPNQLNGGVVIEPKYFKYNLYMKYNNLYLQSNEIFDDIYIQFDLPDDTGLLKTKNYDLYSLVIGFSDALKTTFQQMNYINSKEEIQFRGEKLNLNKRSIVLDNKGKYKFISTLYNALLDDSNFVNEYAKINGKSSDEAIKTLQNYITTSEYKFSNDSNYTLTISAYHQGSKIYRLEIVDTETNGRYQLDIEDGQYYLDYFVDNKNIYSFSLVYSFNERESLNEKSYIITFDRDDLITDISLSLEEAKTPNIKKKEIDSFKNIKDLTPSNEEYIKNKTKYYIEDVSFIDKIKDMFKEKCTKDLHCVCNGNECDCTYNNSIIKCPIELVKDVSTDTTTTTETSTSTTTTTIAN